MEELRKDAKKLAYTNLFIPLVFMVLGIISLGSFVSNNMIDGIKYHVTFMVFAELLLYIFYFFFWFNFLESFRRSYEGSNTIIPAVNIAKVIMILKIVFMFFGIIASIVAVSRRGGWTGNIMTDEWGLYTEGTIKYIYIGLRVIVFALTSIMYFLLSESTERKSEMWFISLTLIALAIVTCVTDIKSEAYGWLILKYVYYILEFVFLYRIAQGYEFKGCKKQEITE
ncbi:MAG: hypothetical protein II765_06540 [Lachnospiraceae bacterium]|nr:hypothetical protein [Lachnospiraceae bacterium]